MGPSLLPIRLINPKHGPLIVRRIISRAVKIYLYLLNKTGLHELSISPVKTSQGTIFISNHSSLLDALYYMALYPEICAIIKQDLFHLSPFSLISYCAGYVANSSRGDTVDKVVSILKSGQNIFIFPQGTRTKGDQLLHLKRGASMIALRSGAPMYFGQIKHSEEILGKDTPLLSVPKERIRAQISFLRIPPEILAVDTNETPWIASRRITKWLEMNLNLEERSASA